MYSPSTIIRPVMNYSIIFSAILGAFLGFLATLTSGIIVESSKKRGRLASFKIRFKLELIQAASSLDEIRNAQSRQKWYDYALLNVLDTNVNNLETIRKDVHLIPNSETQLKAYATITKISLLAQNMRSIQDYEWSTEPPAVDKDDLIKDRRVKHDIEMLDLKRDIAELQKALV